MDRNKYYGGDSASLTPLEDLFTKFGMPAPDQAQYGRGRWEPTPCDEVYNPDNVLGTGMLTLFPSSLWPMDVSFSF